MPRSDVTVWRSSVTFAVRRMLAVAFDSVARAWKHLQAMKRIFNKFKIKISSKHESPPPYVENVQSFENVNEQPRSYNQIREPSNCEVLDLLANCKITDDNESEAEYAEIEEMGLWHSTPLPGRHKSKISLTWVLKENLDNLKPSTEVFANNNNKIKDVRYERNPKTFTENVRHKKCRTPSDRVVGRNEYYNSYKFKAKNICDGRETGSEDSVGTEEYSRRRHRHKHRRRKSKTEGKFGYDIRDVDEFLSAATIDRPGNIPVVVAYPTTLYETQGGVQNEMELPLGTVVNAVFKNRQWLYVQTPHGREGYILYTACLPLGILPRTNSAQKKTPCWESSTDIYPRPCGNLTDTEKEQLRGRTRSECRYRTSNKRKTYTKSLCGEEDFDSLYLRTKSYTNKLDDLKYKNGGRKKNYVSRHYLLVINSDFVGSPLNNTLSVQKGDVVILIEGKGFESDADTDWFYVKQRDGKQGFIPAEIAGHGYI